MSLFAPDRVESIPHIVHAIKQLWRKHPRRNEREALAKIRAAGAILVIYGPKLRRLDTNLATSLGQLGAALTPPKAEPDDAEQLLEEQQKQKEEKAQKRPGANKSALGQR